MTLETDAGKKIPKKAHHLLKERTKNEHGKKRYTLVGNIRNHKDTCEKGNQVAAKANKQ